MQIIVSCGWKVNRNHAVDKIVHLGRELMGSLLKHAEKSGCSIEDKWCGEDMLENKPHSLVKDLTGCKSTAFLFFTVYKSLLH